MLETLKSLVFVIVTVMIALVLQAHAGKLVPESVEAGDSTSVEQIRAYN